MNKKTAKSLSYKISIILSAIAAISFISVFYIENNLVHYIILSVFIVSIFLLNWFYSRRIYTYFLEKYKKMKKKYKKNLKLENLEEITKKKTEEIAQLKANEQFRKEFIGNVAHELKTPIFNIQGFISTLIDGALFDDNVNLRYLERTEKNIQRLIVIVKDLDTISKLETGVIIPDKQKFEVNEIVKDVFDVLELKSNDYGVELISDIKRKIYVYADKEKITEVIHNLVLNSIIYGRKNGRTIIYAKIKKKKVHISVKDNGIGISEKYQKHIFERFFRVDKSRSRERGGSGLGLSIVKHIIDAHNQKISVKSEKGVGTTFTFTLDKID